MRPGRLTRLFWKAVNPLTRPFAGHAPWWVLLETTGHRTGKPRLTPLASGPFDGTTLLLLAVYGERAAFVRNIRSDPTVRVRRRGRWVEGTAAVIDPTPASVAGLGRYARWVLLRIAADPKLVRVSLG